jgi:hypothetical protein
MAKNVEKLIFGGLHEKQTVVFWYPVPCRGLSRDHLKHYET